MSDDALAALLSEMQREFPRFRVVKKGASGLSRAIDVALKVLSLGGMRTYLTEYRTVIGDTLYVPDDWEEVDAADRVICLRHERVHLRQRRRYTMPLFAMAYLFLPLPI